ncbi:MAG: type IV pilin protein [Gammaproteobacteria bacterium]
MKNSARGMTLIELMIVVAILGIIVAIGYPSYLDHVKKTRRTEGMGELLELADRMERHYSDVGTYDQSNGSDMTATVIMGGTTTENGYYTLAIAAGTNNVSFTASAAPTSKGKQNTDKCGTFTITSQGVKSVSGPYTNDDCNWR